MLIFIMMSIVIMKIHSNYIRDCWANLVHSLATTGIKYGSQLKSIKMSPDKNKQVINN